jgi:Fibronectin type III domain
MRALLVVSCVLGACSGSDPCEGRSGTCISLTVEGAALAIDQLTVTVDQPVVEAQSTPIRAITLPARIGLNLPASVDGKVNIGIVALAGNLTVGRGSGSSLVSHHHGTAQVTLMGNAMPDLAGADLSSVMMMQDDGGGGGGDDLASADLAEAVDLAMPTVPDAPTNVVASSGVAQVTVTWNAPANTGGVPLTAFVVTPSPSAAPITTSDGTTTMAVFNGLTNGTTYTFAVAAKNSVGLGPATTSNPATPTATPLVPTAPTSVVATANADSAAHVTWVASDNRGSPISKYTATASPGGASVSTNDGITTSVDFHGLTPGTMYTFTVTSQNGIGTSATSAASNQITVATVPGAPTAVMAMAGTTNNTAKVSWSAPASNGFSAITKYTVTAAPGGASAMTSDGSTLNATVSGLSAGVPYTFTVVATNAMGNGAGASTFSTLTLPMHDVLIVVASSQTNLGAGTYTSEVDFFDGYTGLPDGTNSPTRFLGPFGFGVIDLAVDAANDVLYLASSDGSSGTVHMNGYKNVATIHGTPPATADYTFTLNGYAPVALDPIHKMFYCVGDLSKTDSDPIPMGRYSYSSLSNLTGALSNIGSLALGGGIASQLFVDQASGDVWAASQASGGQGCIAWQETAYTGSARGATIYRLGTTQSFWEYRGVAYTATNGGTIYGSDVYNGGLAWLSNVAAKASGTYDWSGALSFGQGGQLAVAGNKLLVTVPTASVAQYGLPNPSGNPLKTVSNTSLGTTSLQYNSIQYVP